LDKQTQGGTNGDDQQVAQGFAHHSIRGNSTCGDRQPGAFDLVVGSSRYLPASDRHNQVRDAIDGIRHSDELNASGARKAVATIRPGSS
jgi:hypothetical protein